MVNEKDKKDGAPSLQQKQWHELLPPSLSLLVFVLYVRFYILGI